VGPKQRFKRRTILVVATTTAALAVAGLWSATKLTTVKATNAPPITEANIYVLMGTQYDSGIGTSSIAGDGLVIQGVSSELLRPGEGTDPPPSDAIVCNGLNFGVAPIHKATFSVDGFTPVFHGAQVWVQIKEGIYTAQWTNLTSLAGWWINWDALNVDPNFSCYVYYDHGASKWKLWPQGGVSGYGNAERKRIIKFHSTNIVSSATYFQYREKDVRVGTYIRNGELDCSPPGMTVDFNGKKGTQTLTIGPPNWGQRTEHNACFSYFEYCEGVSCFMEVGTFGYPYWDDLLGEFGDWAFVEATYDDLLADANADPEGHCTEWEFLYGSLEACALAVATPALQRAVLDSWACDDYEDLANDDPDYGEFKVANCYNCLPGQFRHMPKNDGDELYMKAYETTDNLGNRKLIVSQNQYTTKTGVYDPGESTLMSTECDFDGFPPCDGTACMMIMEFAK
jgi:hypothetical protein